MAPSFQSSWIYFVSFHIYFYIRSSFKLIEKSSDNYLFHWLRNTFCKLYGNTRYTDGISLASLSVICAPPVVVLDEQKSICCPYWQTVPSLRMIQDPFYNHYRQCHFSWVLLSRATYSQVFPSPFCTISHQPEHISFFQSLKASL